jgi:hypothetical protein
VPVTLPVGAGLTPSDVSSVAPSGIPVVPTDPPAPIPSGEVTPSEGVAVSGSSTCANAGPAHNKHQAVATTNNGLMKESPIRAEGPQSAAADVQTLVQCIVQLLLFCVERRKPVLLRFVRRRIWREIFGSRLNAYDRRSCRRRGCQSGALADLGSDANWARMELLRRIRAQEKTGVSNLPRLFCTPHHRKSG